VKKNIVAIVLSYLTLYIVWGSTYLAIRVAVATIPPFYLVAFRFLLSGGAFLLIALPQAGSVARRRVKSFCLPSSSGYSS